MALTKAQLEALKNSLLASQQPIIASTHRELIQNIIDEMYDAQSRGNLLAGVQIDGTTTTGDTLVLIRSGQAYLVPTSLFTEVAGDFVTRNTTQTITGAKTFENELVRIEGINPEIRLRASSNKSAIKFRTLTNQDNGEISYDNSEKNLKIETRGDNADIVIAPNGTGKVGVGSTTPTEKLDVNGKLRIRGNVNGVGDFVTISAVKVIQHRTASQTAFELSNIGKGVSNSEGFFTPDKISNYSVAFNLFRNTSYTFLANYYEIRRILEINLSGDCFVPAGVTLTISLKVGSNIYASCTIIGGAANFWNIKYILSISSTTEVKVTGVLNANTGNSISAENINENFSSNKDISIQGIFSSSDASNAIRSNQIFVRLN
jgi:hypothetical protein